MMVVGPCPACIRYYRNRKDGSCRPGCPKKRRDIERILGKKDVPERPVFEVVEIAPPPPKPKG